MDFPDFFVSPLDEKFRVLKIAVATRLSNVLVPMVPGALSIITTYAPQENYLSPAQTHFPLRIDFRNREGSEILLSFPESVSQATKAVIRGEITTFLRDSPYSISLLTSGRRVDWRVCKMPTDWLKKIIPRMSFDIGLGGDSTTSVNASFTFVVRPELRHGDWHLLCDIGNAIDSERLEFDRFPELQSASSIYEALLERTLGVACRLHGRGALVDPSQWVITNWRLGKTQFRGVYGISWSHKALTKTYDGALGFMMHVAESNGNPLLHFEGSPNAVVRNFMAHAVTAVTGQAAVFQRNLLMVYADNYDRALEIFTAVSLFKKLAKGSVEVRRSDRPFQEHALTEEVNTWSTTGGKPITTASYIDLDFPDSRFSLSVQSG